MLGCAHLPWASRPLPGCPAPLTESPVVSSRLEAEEAALLALLQDASTASVNACPAYALLAATPPGQAEPSLRLRLSFKAAEVMELPSADTRGILWGTTLGLAPVGCGDGEYLLRAQLLTPAAESKVYEWRERVPRWGQCGQLAAPDDHRRQGGAVVPRMLAFVYREILEDMRADTSSAPLVYIAAPSGLPIAEQTTREIRPFSRMSFDEAQAAAAAYRLSIQVSSSVEATSVGGILGRYPLALMTMGGVSLCSDTLFTLTAVLSDREKKELRRYEFLERVRTPMAPPACRAAEPSARPAVVDSLVRKLYDAMLLQEDLPRTVMTGTAR